MRTRQKDLVIRVHTSAESVDELLSRVTDIQRAVARVAGVMRGMTTERLRRQDNYWQNTLNGWGDHLSLLSQELTSIRLALAKKVCD